MTTIIIKPGNEKFCMAVFESSETSVMLAKVFFAENEPEIIDLLSNYKPEDVESLLFDGSVYAQTAAGIREKTSLPVRIFKEKKEKADVHDRIEAQREWLASNMKYNSEMKNDPHYAHFIRLLSDYNPNNPNGDTTAAGLMAAAARFFRRMNF